MMRTNPSQWGQFFRNCQFMLTDMVRACVRACVRECECEYRLWLVPLLALALCWLGTCL